MQAVVYTIRSPKITQVCIRIDIWAVLFSAISSPRGGGLREHRRGQCRNRGDHCVAGDDVMQSATQLSPPEFMVELALHRALNLSGH